MEARPVIKGRLWWLPLAPIRGMKDIGERALCGRDLHLAIKLSALLDMIRRVRWSLVEHKCIRLPRENWYRAPIFLSGDFISWDTIA